MRAELASDGGASPRRAELLLAERHAQFSNIMAASTIASSSTSIASISAKTTKTGMANTSISIGISSITSISTSTNTSIANNSITSTAFSLSSLSLSERWQSGKAESACEPKQVSNCRSGAVLGPFGASA